jgi:exodeoxyribonuclease VII large subunit
MTDRRRAFPNTRAPLTPEVLASTIRISAPEGIVAVQGIAKGVTEPRSYGGRVSVYGELVLGDALVSFVVPAERAPREGQPVIIEGYLRFKLLTRSNNGSWRGDWKVMLVGQVVGEWVPMVAAKPMLPLPQRGTRKPLTEFIREHGAQSLLVLSTHTGHRDLAQSVASGGCDEQPAFMEANFGAADAFLHTLATIPTDSDVRGLAIVRGGGNALDVIAGSREVVAALLNTGLPFYTALGHDTDVSLADRSADQVFHSPSELGAAIARAVRDAYDRITQARRVSAQSALLDQQKVQLDEQARRMAELQAEAIWAGDAAKARASNLRSLLIGAGLLVALLLWLLVGRG